MLGISVNRRRILEGGAGVDEAGAAAAVRVEGTVFPAIEEAARGVPVPVAASPTRGDGSGAANAVGTGALALFENESLLWFCAESPSCDGTVGVAGIFVVFVGGIWSVVDKVCCAAVGVIAGRRINLWGFFATVLAAFWSDDGLT